MKVVIGGAPSADGEGNDINISMICEGSGQPIPRDAVMLLNHAIHVLLEKLDMSLKEAPRELQAPTPDSIPPPVVPPSTISFPGDLSSN